MHLQFETSNVVIKLIFVQKPFTLKNYNIHHEAQGFHPAGMFSFLIDLWPQSRAGMISTVEVLKLMEAFVNEPNYTVWSDLSCNLGVLSSLLSHTDFHEEIQEFIRDLFTPIGLKLGWDSKPGEGEKAL